MSRRIIFLDMDGVMNCSARPPANGSFLYYIDPVCVKRLNRITRETGAVLVIASTWRISWPVPQLAEMFQAAGIEGRIIGVTPNLGATDRGLEIRAWLREYLMPGDAFVIIDDDAMAQVSGSLILTSYLRGLEEEHASLAIRWLTDRHQHIGDAVHWL